MLLLISVLLLRLELGHQLLLARLERLVLLCDEVDLLVCERFLLFEFALCLHLATAGLFNGLFLGLHFLSQGVLVDLGFFSCLRESCFGVLLSALFFLPD